MSDSKKSNKRRNTLIAVIVIVSLIVAAIFLFVLDDTSSDSPEDKNLEKQGYSELVTPQDDFEVLDEALTAVG